MKNRCKNQWEIRLSFCMALGAFLVDFGMFLGPWTLDFECFVQARCYFSKFRFFMFGLIFLWFWKVLGWFGEAFWEPKGDQNGFKIWLKKWVIFGSLLETLWGAKRRVEHPKGRRQKCTGRGRGGVNPPLREVENYYIICFCKVCYLLR